METDSTEHMTTTLEYLSNPVYHAEVFQTKSKQNEENDTISRNDLKFYRKRISALSRDIMRGNTIQINPNVKEAHDAYVKAAIQYFKNNDRSELLQKEYAVCEEEVERKGNQQQQQQQQQKQQHNRNTNTNEAEIIMDAANKSLFDTNTTHQNQNTLDNFVTTKTLKLAEPTKPPQRREINLKSPELRLKGVRRRKDNSPK